MHLLLPPSEGKATPRGGPTFDLERLSFPELNEARGAVLSALIEVSKRDDAARILKVGAKGAHEIVAQCDILSAPCAPAREVYTGVLYEAAQLHKGDDVLIFSGLFGVTTGEDLIPSYRLSMNVSLPGVGPLKSFWRKQFAQWSPNRAKVDNDRGIRNSSISSGDNDNVAVDLRSELYRVTKPNQSNNNVQWWDVRIANSQSKTISHMAKHYRGLLTRALLDAPTQPVDEVARTLGMVSVEAEDNICRLVLVPTGL
ncbi:peroxide stress protein YaaA [Bifidobacterium sp. ESL0745]|uniref:YaaA family protein n=1 Tax=Bifidobacterium sp. ESL0745 TaxID=2983226 RepID=UPI0023F7E0DB|nr:peroxide stress protein YaaA [Bifidobacterium sp. ESL0745]MDF7665183.1 peroxide stress protein YaaA [Bifidobacterium sp. ESL0745]